MTNFTTRIMIAAATLVVAAGSASAQVLTAEIPFTFRAANTVMQAGTYRLSVHTGAGAPIFQIRNAEGGKSVMVMALSPRDPQKAWRVSGNPVLAFECGTSHCALTEVYTGTTTSYGVSHPTLGKDEPTRTALVILHSDKTE